MNFLEAIFSFVFGDGDPNAEYDKRRWQAVRLRAGSGSLGGALCGGKSNVVGERKRAQPMIPWELSTTNVPPLHCFHGFQGGLQALAQSSSSPRSLHLSPAYPALLVCIQIGRYIQSRGGVVAAEEIAPFLDVTPGQVAADRGRVTVDESYMVPVLARLGGEPQVDSRGNLIYAFPSLQATGGAVSSFLVRGLCGAWGLYCAAGVLLEEQGEGVLLHAKGRSSLIGYVGRRALLQEALRPAGCI